jgi:hypothetical protein
MTWQLATLKLKMGAFQAQNTFLQNIISCYSISPPSPIFAARLK